VSSRYVNTALMTFVIGSSTKLGRLRPWGKFADREQITLSRTGQTQIGLERVSGSPHF
jgi:hypothetical protein